MKLRWIFRDVIIEHLRSRMVYLYLVVIVVAITSVLLTISFSGDKGAEATWFSEMVSKSSIEHLKRLRTPVTEGIRKMESLPPARAREEHLYSDAYRLTADEIAVGVPLWIFELPGAKTCSIAIAGRGGMIEEVEGNLGVTGYICSLINHFISKHPEQWPYLEFPMRNLKDSVAITTTCLPEYFISQLEVLKQLIDGPPIFPEEDKWDVLYNIRKEMDDRNKGLQFLAEDTLNRLLFPEHRFGHFPLGRYHDMQLRTHDELKHHLVKLFSPGRCGVIIASPLKAEPLMPQIKEKLAVLGERMPQPPLRITDAVQPHADFFSKKMKRSNKTACAAGFYLRPQADAKITGVFEELFLYVSSDLIWQLREGGLIYSLYEQMFHPNERDTVFTMHFICSPHKTRNLLGVIEKWLAHFPKTVSDEAIKDAISGAKGELRRSMSYSSKAVSKALNQFVSPKSSIRNAAEEQEQWELLTIDEIRSILQLENVEKTIIFGSVGPAEGGVL